MARLKDINIRTRTAVKSLRDLTVREKQHVIVEILRVKDVMPLLMKPRNRQRWSADDKAQLAQHLRRLSRISPYLVVLVVPGGFFVLPALVWWLDRRRNRIRSRTPLQH